ncbi:MAG: phage scaffolding protein [Ruthenibacterium sp.]
MMALEWLKNILGENYTEDIDKKVSDEIGKAFVSRPDYNALNESKKGLETQLKDAGATIEKFKGMDIDGVKKTADEYKAAAEQAAKDADDRVAALQFDHTLEGVIRESKGRNPKAIKALLDVDALRTSQNQAEDMQKALTAIKTENDYLFESADVPPAYAAGTGGAPASEKYTPEIASMRAAAGLANK